MRFRRVTAWDLREQMVFAVVVDTVRRNQYARQQAGVSGPGVAQRISTVFNDARVPGNLAQSADQQQPHQQLGRALTGDFEHYQNNSVGQ